MSIEKYDLNTYLGRVKHCADISSPFNLFHSEQQILALKKQLESGDGTPDELWKAQCIVQSAIHPDTGEFVYLPFRMSCCVISNLVVTVGMLTPGMGTVGTVFWQWMNQSLNVAVNTANANKSHPLSTKQMATNYALAVGGSCGVAIGLNAAVPRLRVSANLKTTLARLVPFAAVASAGILNVFLMRSNEIRKGISVFDADTNEELGTSKRAAVQAVGETALSRVVNSTPVMVIPPLLLLRLQKGPLKGKSMKVVQLANLGLIAATSFAVLPFALAVFPSKRFVSGDKLGDEFKGRRVWFNRGM